MPHLVRRRVASAFNCGASLLAAVGASVAALPEVEPLVRTGGQRFTHPDVSLDTGGRVTGVNDDGDSVHHLYRDASDFAYDSGDIELGDKAVVAFPKAGAFQVLCGMHQRMRLAVRVR